MRKDDRLYKLNKVVERIEDQKGDCINQWIHDSLGGGRNAPHSGPR